QRASLRLAALAHPTRRSPDRRAARLALRRAGGRSGPGAALGAGLEPHAENQADEHQASSGQQPTQLNVAFELLHFFAQLLEPGRSEEHTSELQSRENLVCRLL